MSFQNQYAWQPVGNYFPASGAAPDMLGQYKNPYQQMYGQAYGQPIQAPQMAQANVGADMLWVLGEVEATGYPVAPGNTVTLWDKNRDTIYIKSVNLQGIPSMRILDFTERTLDTRQVAQEHECKCSGKYAPLDQFEALQREFHKLAQSITQHHEEKGVIENG